MKKINRENGGVEAAIRLALEGKSYQVSDAVERTIVRYKFVADQYSLYREKKKIIDNPTMIRRTIVTLLVQEFGISYAQACNDHERATQLLNIVDRIDVREININIVLQEASEGFQMAMESGDYKSAAAFAGVKVNLLKMLPDGKDVNFKQASDDIANMINIYAFDPEGIQSKMPLKERLPNNFEALETLKEKYSKRLTKTDKRLITIELNEDEETSL
jgi:hypothetical protein